MTIIGHKLLPCRHSKKLATALHDVTIDLLKNTRPRLTHCDDDEDDDDDYSVHFLGSGLCSPAVKERAGLSSLGDYRVQCRHATH